MKRDYIQQNKAAFGLQMTTFKNNIGPYATLLSVSAPEVASQAADADSYNYTVTSWATMEQSAQQWANWYKLQRHGGTPPATGAPVGPTLGAAPAAVALGIEQRFRALCNGSSPMPTTTPPSVKPSGSRDPSKAASISAPSSPASNSNSAAARSRSAGAGVAMARSST